jgi:hypothetical protein
MDSHGPQTELTRARRARDNARRALNKARRIIEEAKVSHWDEGTIGRERRPSAEETVTRSA